MSAREDLVNALNEHPCCFSADDVSRLVNGFAHELAELIRNSETLRNYTDDHMDDCFQAANLIDPEVTQ